MYGLILCGPLLVVPDRSLGSRRPKDISTLRKICYGAVLGPVSYLLYVGRAELIDPIVVRTGG